MIKVALLSQSANYAGAEKMLLQLAMLLKDEDDFLPVVLCPQAENITGIADKSEELGIETIKISSMPWYVYTNHENVSQLSRKTLDSVRSLVKELRALSPSLVICNTLTSIAPVLAAREIGIPIITWVHGILDAHFIPADFDLERRLLFDRIVIALSDRVVCCSDWTADYYRPYAEDKVDVITNWTADPGDNASPFTSGKFVCLNTFDENKGVQYLLQAAAILKDKGYRFTLDLYGTGGKEAELREYVTKHKLGETVKFCGRTNDVDKVYRGCFCVINPSDLESFGLTLVEGMSYGKPVIAVSSGGPTTIVEDGVTGFLIPPRDAQAIADKMAWLIDHGDESLQMGKEGRKRYKKLFSPQMAKERFIQIINETIHQPADNSNMAVLIEDAARNILRFEAEGCREWRPDGSSDAQKPMYNEEQLCFSGKIRHRRKYAVSCQTKVLSSISMIFACHDAAPPKGTLTITLRQKKNVLAQHEVGLGSICSDQWCTIPLQYAAVDTDHMVQVELCFDYEPHSGILGVYERAENRDFLYKVFNKLHCPIPGKDALIVSFV